MFEVTYEMKDGSNFLINFKATSVAKKRANVHQGFDLRNSDNNAAQTDKRAKVY